MTIHVLELALCTRIHFVTRDQKKSAFHFSSYLTAYKVPRAKRRMRRGAGAEAGEQARRRGSAGGPAESSRRPAAHGGGGRVTRRDGEARFHANRISRRGTRPTPTAQTDRQTRFYGPSELGPPNFYVPTKMGGHQNLYSVVAVALQTVLYIAHLEFD